MNSSALQNPSDPDAAYRNKSGKSCRGYAANIEETVGKNGSVVTDYRLIKIHIRTTALIGKEAPDALADFVFHEDGTRLLKCAAGHEPLSQTYTKTTRQCRVSFDRNHCAGCPYQEQCALRSIKRQQHLSPQKMPPTEPKARDT